MFFPVRITLAVLCGLAAAVVIWLAGMFIWGGYYSFWEGHESMTRVEMTMAFFVVTSMSFIFLDE